MPLAVLVLSLVICSWLANLVLWPVDGLNGFHLPQWLLAMGSMALLTWLFGD